jgi:hypothetical protein
MTDEQRPEDVEGRASEDLEDVEGHRRREDLTGDDVQGHRRREDLSGDDVEGHRRVDMEDDDVEGHKRPKP